jgi:purine-binding chemotaxis protein CheW
LAHLAFTIDQETFCLELEAVDRVVPALALQDPAGEEPGSCILGTFEYRGHRVAVVDLRKRFGLPERELELSEHFVVVKTSHSPLALRVDQALGLIEPGRLMFNRPLWEHLPRLDGIARSQTGEIVIYDTDGL